VSQQVTEDVGADIVVILTKDNVPVTGLLFSDLTVEYAKEGDVGFTAKALAAPDLTELGDGVYKIAFTALELDTAGTLVIKVNAATIDQSVTLVTVLAAGTVGSGAASLQTCIITGNVSDASGAPVQGAAVIATLLGKPSIEQNTALLADETISVKTDANGEFFMPLVRLADVEIFIPLANYKRTVVVPNQATANLFTEIP
jgi:hypothetical protein